MNYRKFNLIAIIYIFAIIMQKYKCFSYLANNFINHKQIIYAAPRLRSSYALLSTVSSNSDKTDKTNSNNQKKEKSKKNSSTGNEEPLTPESIEEIKRARLAKLQCIKDKGMNPFAYTFDQTHKTSQLQKLCIDLPNGIENPDLHVSVAGRIMIRRVFGKLAFFTLQDDEGSIQLYIDKSRLEDSFDTIKELTDAGDIIGVKGTVKRTDKVNNTQLIYIYIECSIYS